MSIIDSIYESTGAFSIHIKETDNVLLMRGGEIDSIAMITEVGEMYNDHLDCKIMSFRIKNLIKACNGLDIHGIICFEFMDKHIYIKLNSLLKDNKNNGIFLTSEYQLIPKESMLEIKGGIYKTEKDLLDNLENVI